MPFSSIRLKPSVRDRDLSSRELRRTDHVAEDAQRALGQPFVLKLLRAERPIMAQRVVPEAVHGGEEDAVVRGEWLQAPSPRPVLTPLRGLLRRRSAPRSGAGPCAQRPCFRSQGRDRPPRWRWCDARALAGWAAARTMRGAGGVDAAGAGPYQEELGERLRMTIQPNRGPPPEGRPRVFLLVGHYHVDAHDLRADLHDHRGFLLTPVGPSCGTECASRWVTGPRPRAEPPQQTDKGACERAVARLMTLHGVSNVPERSRSGTEQDAFQEAWQPQDGKPKK